MDNPFDPKRKLRLRLSFHPKISVYLDNKKEWRWNIKAANGEITGSSSEGFDSKRNALNNLKLVSDAILKFYEDEKDKPE